MSDASIKAQRKEGKNKFDASPEYRTEMVSPICKYEDIVTVQERIRKQREAGAFANKSCGLHVQMTPREIIEDTRKGAVVVLERLRQSEKASV